MLRTKTNANSYYLHIKNRDIKAIKQRNKQIILEKIKEIYHANHGTPGYRQMKFELEKYSINLSPNTVYKYMKKLKISSITRRKYHYKQGEAHIIFANLLNQKFKVPKPNMFWCSDFTYLHLENGEKHYNCTILDLYDRSVIASVCSNKIDANLAVDTLAKALKQEKYPKNLIFHTDQGSQFTSKKFTEFCKKNRVKQSMSRAGVPYDNAPMERFYNTLKCEFYYLFKFRDARTLYTLINDFVYSRYNYSRPNFYNKGLSPMKKRFLYKKIA